MANNNFRLGGVLNLFLKSFSMRSDSQFDELILSLITAVKSSRSDASRTMKNGACHSISKWISVAAEQFGLLSFWKRLEPHYRFIESRRFYDFTKFELIAILAFYSDTLVEI